MTGPVVRLVFSLRPQLKTAREVNQRMALHIARQEAVITEAIARRDEALDDLAAQERVVQLLMQSCPSDVEELEHG